MMIFSGFYLICVAALKKSFKPTRRKHTFAFNVLTLIFKLFENFFYFTVLLLHVFINTEWLHVNYIFSIYAKHLTPSICLLSAIYLAAVLGVGTISVLFVIIVINVFHTPVEKPIPKWTRRSISLLMKIFCWKGTSCHLKSNKTETVEKTPVTEFTKTPVMTSIDEVEAEDVEEETEMTWKLVAAVLDYLFFLIFMFVVLLSTVIFVSVIVLKYVTY